MKISQGAERNRYGRVLWSFESKTRIRPRRRRQDVGGVLAWSINGVAQMPAWMEVLLDVMAFAGFIGLGTLYRAPDERGDGHSDHSQPPTN
jgi:hypothetical protein